MAGDIRLQGVEYKAQLTYLEDFDWAIVQCIPVEQITKSFELFEVLQGVLIVLSGGLILCIVRIIYSWRKSDHKIYADTLTGCHSRAACVSLLENLEDQRNMRISIIYMDLNKFKYVNDTFGHNQGDKLLAIFGKVLKSVFGKIGFVGRMGGDEFIAVLCDTNDAEIEKMCTEVECILLEQSKALDFPYVISSSYGYASRNVGQPETMSEIMQQADERMYKNKAAKK
jgi:diguanylate cyclase (GGDEF)-like protein